MWKSSSKNVLRLSNRSLKSLTVNNIPKDVQGEIPRAYSPAFVEEKWYEWWESNSVFCRKEHDSSKGKFSMVLPPPNITGTLHLGHALTCAIQDSLVSWNRMKGKHTVWFPGCDHAGIATQAIVERNLKSQNTSREQLGRDRFLEEVWKWKDEKQTTIYQQLKGLGATLNWERSAFTMDPKMCRAVNEAFIRLHRSEKIYRDESLVNWSCQLRTAISDIEVDHRVIDEPRKITVPGYDKPVAVGYIYDFAYKISDSDHEHIVVSTTRPETIPGDTAIAVNPDDPRYTKYIGRFAHHPIRNDKIPIIADSRVDQQFGTGAMKITPAHDVKDYEIAKRHGLRMLSIFDNRGMTNQHCGQFSNLPRFEVREKIVDFLKDSGLLIRISPHQMSVPICSRSGDIVEPLLRPQWFVRTKDMAQRAAMAVTSGDLKIHPNNFESVWFDWLENIKDWCISRQLWWGHRIPAYRLSQQGDGVEKWVAAHDLKEATEYAAAHFGNHSECISQDEDVLDTWFSSSLFPFSVCGWPQNTLDLQKFFPLDVMETGHDILFFWVARMAMMSLELTNKLPFKEIVLHGIICDSQGRKMSKSLGNVIDPLDIIHGISLPAMEEKLNTSLNRGHLSREEFNKAIDEKRSKFPDGITQTGADALRFTLCSYNVKNHFINMDMAILKRNRLFCNKIWQATRFLVMRLDQISSGTHSPYSSIVMEPSNASLVNQWIMSSLHHAIVKINNGMSSYDFHHATEALYDFLYGHLCDVYVEAFKPLSGKEQQESVLVLATCLDASLRCLTPFMPFISEELYQRLHSKLDQYAIQMQRSHSVLNANYPEKDEFAAWENAHLLMNFDLILRAGAALRNMKLDFGLAKTKPDAVLVCPHEEVLSRKDQYSKFLETVAGLKSLTIVPDMRQSNPQTENLIARTVDDCSVQLNVAGLIDIKAELKKNEDKLKKLVNNLTKLETVMSSSSYSANAPLHVQEAHRTKVEALRNEISQLRSIAKNLTS